jgi:hypothetical protein
VFASALQIAIGAIAAPAFSVGCATTRGPAPQRLVTLREGPLELRVEVPALRAKLVDEVTRALPAIAARLGRHDLVPRARVLLRFHSGVDGFVQATGQHASHLRAWAGYDTVDLLPPDTWRVQTRSALVERVTHELCHTAIYQRLGDERRARALVPPFFFDEGTCSVTALQGARRMPVDGAVAHLGDVNPFRDRGLAAANPAVAYAASHHAMAEVARIAGPLAFAHVIDRVRDAADGSREDVHGPDRNALHDRWRGAIEGVTGADVDAIWARAIRSVGAPPDVSAGDLRENPQSSSTRRIAVVNDE